MPDVTIIVNEIARSVFQLYDATATGAVAFREKLSRRQLLDILQNRPPALVVMKAFALPIIEGVRSSNWP